MREQNQTTALLLQRLDASLRHLPGFLDIHIDVPRTTVLEGVLTAKTDNRSNEVRYGLRESLTQGGNSTLEELEMLR